LQVQANISPSANLPFKRSLTKAYILSLIVVIGTAVASVVGVLYQTTVYPTEEMRQAFVANDVVNLFIGLPILIGSLWLARRGQLIGLLLWPGTLLYGLYNYAAYVFGRPLDWLTFIHLALVLLSAYIVFDLLNNMDQKAIQAQITGAVPQKTAGWVLVGFGVVFLFRAISMIAEASANQVTLPISDMGVLIADTLLSLLLIAGGGLLLRRMPLGYASGLGLLFATSMLFIGLILFLLLQPVLTDAPFVLADVVVIAIMGLVCFIPFALFVRGVWHKGGIIR
jgi:hypothetical protein